MKQAVTLIKSWFETGDKPTQSQFWDWLDSFWHKDDSIPIGSVSGLNTSLATLATQASVNALKAIVVNTSAPTVSVALPAGVILDKIRIKSTSTQTFNVGLTANGSDILEAEQLNSNQPGIYTVDIDCDAATTIFFSSLLGNNIIKIYIQQ